MKRILQDVLTYTGIAAGIIFVLLTVIAVSSVVAENVPPSTKTPTTEKGNGATAICRDGFYTYATSHTGACSRHGGVEKWLE